MDYENLNCPQYVHFDSVDFLEDILNNSTRSVLNGDKSPLASYSPETSNINQSQDTSVFSEDSISQEISGEASKENIDFSVHQPQFVVPTNKQKQDKSILSNTIPVPFNFKTDNRVKNSTVATYKEQDFTAQLRKTEYSKQKAVKLTKVQPFDLHESKQTPSKRKFEETEYVSMAEQVAAFEKTPARYRTVAKGKNFQPPEHWEPSELRPVSPKLQAVKRRRVVTAISREEREEQEAEEMKTFAFHASPLNPKIYPRNSAMILRSGKKLRPKQVEKKFKFKAKPVPKSILRGPTGLGEKPEVRITIPQPPVFETNDRIEKRKLRDREHVPVVTKKQPVKKQAVPPPCSPIKNRLTHVQPFSFDHQDQERFKRKEEKIKKELEKEKEIPEFHALPLPDLKPCQLPAVSVKQVTEVKPFQFDLNAKTAKHDKHAVEEPFVFKAQPPKVLEQEPFVPKKSDKHTTDIKAFSLHTRTRASERQHLRELREAEEAEHEQSRLIRQQQERSQDQAELVKLRQELVHKAQPVMHYPGVEVKPSGVPLTRPQSPKFETDKRLSRSMRR